jgi:hypothetical protein
MDSAGKKINATGGAAETPANVTPTSPEGRPAAAPPISRPWRSSPPWRDGAEAEPIEALARLLHEAGREAVARGLVVRTDVPIRPFIEWDGLTGEAREGRRVQARFLAKHADDVVALVTAVALLT